jgi:hypothetical protein
MIGKPPIKEIQRRFQPIAAPAQPKGQSGAIDAG